MPGVRSRVFFHTHEAATACFTKVRLTALCLCQSSLLMMCLGLAWGVVYADSSERTATYSSESESSGELANVANNSIPREPTSTTTSTTAAVAVRSSIINERSITSRVLGGGDAEPGEWPSVVALVRFGSRALQDRIFCGGTVVADRWVMTAAHCLFNTSNRIESPSGIRVVAGITDLQNDAFVDEVIVTNIFIHPDYDNTIELPPNDIALLELANVVDAPTTELFVGDTRLYTGTMSFVAGWGATQFENEVSFDFPTRLQDASVPLVSQAECNMPQSYDGLVTTRQLCAGFREGGIDTCAGDSGGPLFIRENGRTLQVGITSFGNGCGLADFFGIYTNVSYFIPWLSNYITVPAQSAALIAEREAEGQPGSGASAGDDRRGFFGGAINPLALLLLCVLTGIRKVKKCQRKVASRGCEITQAGTSKRGKFGALGHTTVGIGATLLLLASGCAANTANTANTANISDSQNPVISTTNEEFAVFHLSEQTGRAGIDSVTLGQSRSAAMASLKILPMTQTRCHAEKTGLKGTGRMFLKEICVFEPDAAQRLATLEVKRITAQFLDDQLIGLELVANGASMTELMEHINSLYEQDETAARPFEWISASEDAIRLRTAMAAESDDDLNNVRENTSEVTIQMIDRALDGRIPAMFQTP